MPLLRLAIERKIFPGKRDQGPYIFLGRLAESIKQQNLARVVTHLSPFADVAVYCVRKKYSLRRIPYILRVDGIYIDELNTIGNSEILNQQIVKSVKGAIGVVFNSDFCRRVFEAFYGQIDKPYTVVHSAVPLSEFSPVGDNLRTVLNISQQDIVFVTSALWRRHKRLPETIELFQQISSRIPQGTKLLVLGGNAKPETNSDNIIYAGHIEPDRLPNWYRTGDLYLHLAWIEPSGNTQVEAMSCGLPVVCVNNGGIGESVTACSGGIVSEADQAYEFKKVDYYNPPRPNFDRLLQDVLTITKDISSYKNNIRRLPIDINGKACQYVSFIKQCLDY